MDVSLLSISMMPAFAAAANPLFPQKASQIL